MIIGLVFSCMFCTLSVSVPVLDNKQECVRALEDHQRISRFRTCDRILKGRESQRAEPKKFTFKALSYTK